MLKYIDEIKQVGFDKDLKCRDFQYEIGKEYEEEKAEECLSCILKVLEEYEKLN